MNFKNLLITAAAMLFLSLGTGAVFAQPQEDTELLSAADELRQDLQEIDPAPHIKELSALPSRFTGYPGNEKAAEYVMEQYEEMGLANIEREPFQMIVPIEDYAHVRVDDQEVPIHCVRPNYVRTPKTPESGIRGRLIWGGQGRLSDFNGKDVEGSIVLMEFNSATRWLNAAKLGARAIIFVEPTRAFRSDAEQKYTSIPAPIPRYYIQREQIPALARAFGARGEDEDETGVESALEYLREKAAEEQDLSVHADMRWEEKTVYRISGEIPGIDPKLGNETVVVHAYYDSTSVVPALAPGAESSCGISAQIEMARFLTEHPPRRTVKVLATPGHFQALYGVRSYVQEEIYPKRTRKTDSEETARSGEPDFFIGLDLSSRYGKMAGFYKGNFYDQYGDENEIKLQRIFSDYSDSLLGWAEDLTGHSGFVEDFEFESGIVPQYGRDWRSLLPDQAAFDSEVVTLSGRPAITLATTGDPRNAVNTPLDTFQEIEPYLSNARKAAIVSAFVVKQTADMPVIPLNDKMELGQIGSIFGRAIEQTLTTYVPTINVPDAIAAVSLSMNKSMMGVSGRSYARSDVQGLFEVFGQQTNKKRLVDGFTMSPSDGTIHSVGQSDPEVVPATDRVREEWDLRRTDLRLNFLESNSTTLFDLVDPLHLAVMNTTTPLRGEANSEVRAQDYKTFIGEQISGSSYGEPLSVIFTKPGTRLKFLMASGGTGNAGVLLNTPVDLDEKSEAVGGDKAEERFLGEGFRNEDKENFVYHTTYQVARDMHLLDYYRLDHLERSAISQKNLWDLHNETQTQLELAQEARAEKRWDDYYRHARLAWSSEGRVYPDVRATAHDVVRGVIFYFALLLPFVIFIERLLLNYVDIRKKLGSIFVLFAISYLVLRLVHPAFQLSEAPIIILDGFFMLVASGWTIGYLLLKFQNTMAFLRQHIDTIHRADVARASAAMAAFILGISNMRKRKIRTALTALTLILLTFTILSFTSFETRPARMLQYGSQKEAPYNGVLLRTMAWSPLGEFEVYDVTNYFRSEGYSVAERSWVVSRDEKVDLNLDVKRGDGRGGDVVAHALLGLSEEEKEFSGVDDFVSKGNWIKRAGKNWPFVTVLPEGMAESLRIESDDIGSVTVNVLGRELLVIGTINSAEMFAYEDLDGEPLTPVDFMQEASREEEDSGAGPAFTATGEQTAENFIAAQREEDDESEYIHMTPDQVLIVPNELCLQMGGTYRAVVAGPGDEGDTASFIRDFGAALREFAGRINLPLYAGIDGYINRIATRSSLSMGGVQGLLVPILIAALIVFNTMLGAVYERTDEIKVYASVGLAPIHIAALFFAESCVFAVLGAMMGYLTGQVLSFGLMQVPWLMEGISLNYSSISAVWSAMLVMVVVLASTAWPARMAGKLSVPDETKQLTIEPPESDVWEILFPFTVSSKESTGVMAYLREYFVSNDADSVGAFTADNIQLFGEEDEKGRREIILEADVWVAPLDMGISQHVRIAAVPDEEEPEITYLYFTITRKTGEFATWGRMNKGFLKDLRKQLLIWRLVTPEEKQRLSDKADEILD
ncbi:MAG: FtsX-like permease family protein [Planctomycetota bacterium]